MKHVASACLLSLLVIGLWGAIAKAEMNAAEPVSGTDNALPDRFMLRLSGFFINNSDILLRVDRKRAPVGAYLDFAETLGGETNTTAFRLDSCYRFSPWHALAFAWYRTALTGAKTVDRDIQIGDQVFPVFASVNSDITTDVYKLNYQYSLFHNEQAEISVLAGFHVMNLGIGVDAPRTGQTYKKVVTAPLPILGYSVAYKFSPKLTSYLNYQLFFINYQDSFQGSLQDFLLGLEYRVFPNVAVGGAFNSFQFNTKMETEDSIIHLKDGYVGLMAYVSLYL